MSDIERLTQAISPLIAMDFSSTLSAEPWPDTLRPLAQAIDVLAQTIKKETVAPAHVGALFQAMPVAMLQLNRDGCVVGHNDAATELLGFTPNGVSLTALLADLAPAPRPPLRLEDLTVPTRVTLLDMAGQERHVELRQAPLRGRFGELQGHVLSAVDVTSDVLALQQTQEAAAARTRLLARLSHELRTPLNGIIGTTDAVLRDGVRDHHTELGRIASCSHHLMGLLDDFLDFTKLDAGTPRLSAVPFELSALLQQAASIIRPRLPDAVALKVHQDPGMPMLLGDPLRIHQILLNLLGNAVRFTEHGSICLQATTTPAADDLIRVVLSVEDTGCGIRPEKQEAIFQPYTQVSSSEGGTGLGLSIVNQLVSLMGGDISLHSSIGQGSCFTVQLMLRRAPVEPSSAPAAPPPPPSVRILLVDDNPMNRLVIRCQLEQLGCTVSEACDGQEAVDRLSGARLDVDLVLMDCHMPRLGGADATRQIRTHHDASALPIVALTATAVATERETCIAAGWAAWSRATTRRSSPLFCRRTASRA